MKKIFLILTVFFFIPFTFMAQDNEKDIKVSVDSKYTHTKSGYGQITFGLFYPITGDVFVPYTNNKIDSNQCYLGGFFGLTNIPADFDLSWMRFGFNFEILPNDYDTAFFLNFDMKLQLPILIRNNKTDYDFGICPFVQAGAGASFICWNWSVSGGVDLSFNRSYGFGAKYTWKNVNPYGDLTKSFSYQRIEIYFFFQPFSCL